jgi:para-nitrobenzyl esterase
VPGVLGTVDVDGGWIRGVDIDGIAGFLGVPYARAPSGPLRWRPPQPVKPWSGVRAAAEPGLLAPQPGAGAGASLPGDPARQSEDCLHLSIWTPGLDRGRRPVMVWIHGGGFVTGTAGSLLYRGDDLARRGDVVVVAVNYRLGALGFLAHPSLAVPGDATFANWALLDQIAALRWVRDHIASFGGDPGNVTLFGESAGAMCASALLSAPPARGLFRRVAIQSGPPYTHTATRAGSSAEALAAELGMATVTRDALVEVPAGDLVQATAALQSRRGRPGELPIPFLPTVDGSLLPDEPLQAVSGGAAANMDVLVGTNRDEMTLFLLSEGHAVPLDDEQLLRRVRHMAPGAEPETIVSAYREARGSRGEPVSPRDLWVAAASDVVFRWPSLRLAAAHHRYGRTFVYLFTWETPVFGGVLGASHGLDIPFVFGSVRHATVSAFAGGGSDAEALSERMQAAWVAFARSGDPSNDLTGEWPAWDPGRRTTMVFGRTTAPEERPRDAELAVLDAHYPLEHADAPARSSDSTKPGRRRQLA